MDSKLDLWKGEYTYRCILTNGYESSMRDIMEFYNMRGGRITHGRANDLFGAITGMATAYA